MFFIASKIIWALIAPLNLLYIMAAAGVILWPFARRMACGLWAVGLTLFLTIGLLPLGSNLLTHLENGVRRPAALPDKIDGIIVLGGAFETDIADRRQVIALNDGAERIAEAVMLARAHPEAKLVFSGGEGRLRPAGHPESRDVQIFLGAIGFTSDRIIYEDASRNTYENVRFSQNLVLPAAGEAWVVVTSAYHMRRALAVFTRNGWPGLVPWPVDYRTGGTYIWRPVFDISGNFYKLEIALKEYIGAFVYRLRG